MVLKEFESHFPGRNQLWKCPFNVSFSYERRAGQRIGRVSTMGDRGSEREQQAAILELEKVLASRTSTPATRPPPSPDPSPRWDLIRILAC